MPPLYLFRVKCFLQGENVHRKKFVRKCHAEMWKKHDNLPRRGQISPQRQIECSRHNFEDRVKVDTDSESWKDSTYCPLLLFFRWDVSFMVKNCDEVRNVKFGGIWGHLRAFEGTKVKPFLIMKECL